MMLCRKGFMQQRGRLQLTGAFKLTRPPHPPCSKYSPAVTSTHNTLKGFQQISPQINLGTFCQPDEKRIWFPCAGKSFNTSIPSRPAYVIIKGIFNELNSSCLEEKKNKFSIKESKLLTAYLRRGECVVMLLPYYACALHVSFEFSVERAPPGVLWQQGTWTREKALRLNSVQQAAAIMKTKETQIKAVSKRRKTEWANCLSAVC